MSGLATFHLVPKSALDALLSSATPTKTWLGNPKDQYPAFLAQNGREVATYEWSGYVLLPLFTFLQERGIDLLDAPDYDDLVARLATERQAGFVVLTDAHKAVLLDRLKPEAFSLDELQDFYNDFNASDEDGVGVPMRDGIRALAEALSSVDPASIVLVAIG